MTFGQGGLCVNTFKNETAENRIQYFVEMDHRKKAVEQFCWRKARHLMLRTLSDLTSHQRIKPALLLPTHANWREWVWNQGGETTEQTEQTECAVTIPWIRTPSKKVIAYNWKKSKCRKWRNSGTWSDSVRIMFDSHPGHTAGRAWGVDEEVRNHPRCRAPPKKNTAQPNVCFRYRGLPLGATHRAEKDPVTKRLWGHTQHAN